MLHNRAAAGGMRRWAFWVVRWAFCVERFEEDAAGRRRQFFSGETGSRLTLHASLERVDEGFGLGFASHHYEASIRRECRVGPEVGAE